MLSLAGVGEEFEGEWTGNRGGHFGKLAGCPAQLGKSGGNHCLNLGREEVRLTA